MQTTEAKIANPLNLPVEWRCPAPVQDYADAAHVAEIAASMEREGWNGPPVVADYELREAGQDRAYTGTHRVAAWRDAGHDGDLPCVYIEDLAEALGIDWRALMDEHDGDGWEAAAALCHRAPADVREAYGLDVGGA